VKNFNMFLLCKFCYMENNYALKEDLLCDSEGWLRMKLYDKR
jgi:hypothetical protein